jgi:hypothetical protein
MSCKTSILVLAANPKDTPSLRLNEEVREIQSGLQRNRRKSFYVRQDLAARPRDVRRSLLEHRPLIVHFCGHGIGEEGLLLEDDHGSSQLVSTDAIAGLFELFCNQVKCVVLNACFSESQARAIVSHVEFVVGMSREIGDRAAIEFAMGFYDAIAAGESYEIAFRFGCNAIELAGLYGHRIPVLLKKSDHLPVPSVTHSAPSSEVVEQTRSSGDNLSLKSLKALQALGWSTSDVMKRLEQLDYENVAGLDEISEGGVDQWATVAESNPDGYTFAVDRSGQIVGYWHFEALPDDLFTKALRGGLEDSQITVDNITFLCAPGVVDIYFIIFVVEKKHRGFKANRLLLEGFLDRLEELAEAGIYVRKICANAFTPEGVGLCKSMGMSLLQEHSRSGFIFCVDLRDSGLLLRARPRLSEALNQPFTLTQGLPLR